MSALQANPFLMAGGDSEYTISRSLRFYDGDQSNLNRTPSTASNRKTFTWSGWTKRSELGGTQRLMFVGPGSNYFSISFNNDRIQVEEGGGSYGFYVYTTGLFRDPSAWYHVVVAFDVTQATQANRVKVYVNGEDQDITAAGGWPSQNVNFQINNTVDHRIGRNDADCFNGLLADLHFIDGQALAPTNFGEFDNNNVWQPIEYTGSYGTNGFHLDFKDNSTSAALGTDTSGNSNNWTVNNLSVASGPGNDSLVDSPHQIADQTDSGSGGEISGNYATLNPLRNGQTLSNGNLDVVGSNGWQRSTSTIAVSSGKWYWEYKINASNEHLVGVGNLDMDMSGNLGAGSTGSRAGSGYGTETGFVNGIGANGSWSNTGGSTTGDLIGVAFDADAGNMYIYKNGTSLNSGIPSHTGLTDGPYYFVVSLNGSSRSGSVNFGQRPFAYQNAGTNRPSADYKAVNTANLPEPTIENPSEHFDIKLWTGNGASNPQTGLGFSPDLVWIKSRSDGQSHAWHDSVRGPSKQVRSNTTGTEGTSSTTLTSFDSNGFTVNNNNISNQTNKTYVGWAWDAGTNSAVSNTNGDITSSVKANTTAGFSICTYTGNGGIGQTVGHGLSAAPEFIFCKCRNSGVRWGVYTKGVGPGNTLVLNTTGGPTGGTGVWGNVYPTSSVFYVSNDPEANGGNNTYVAYCFTPVEGYSAMGKYTANTTSGSYPFIYTGFQPRWIMFKNISASWGWYIHDTARSVDNSASEHLIANYTNSESNYNIVDILSNGFKLTTVSEQWNHSSNDYVYLAFAEHPFKTARAR